MRPFIRGAQKRLAASTEVPDLKSQTGFLDDELYAAHVEIARLRAQVDELAPVALLGAGVRSGILRFHLPDNAAIDEETRHLYRRILAGEFGEERC